METTLHKLSFYGKKLSLTMVFVVLGWFVHSREFNYGYYDEEVKVIKFYPNPATSFINFEFTNNIIEKTYILEIYSFVGRKIMEVPVSANKITLTFNNDFYRGLYIFHLRDKSGKVIDYGKFQVIR